MLEILVLERGRNAKKEAQPGADLAQAPRSKSSSGSGRDGCPRRQAVSVNRAELDALRVICATLVPPS